MKEQFLKLVRTFVLITLVTTSVFTFEMNFGNVANAATFEMRISTGTDDAEQNFPGGFMYLNSSDIELVDDIGSQGLQNVGLRFQAIAVPQRATITNAYIEFEVDELTSTTTNITFYGQDVDDALTFTTTDSDISNRTKTTASVAWNSIPAWSVISEKKQTPDLSTIVQEIVDRGGWASGNDIVFIVTGSGERVAESYEGESANAPLLHIEYSEQGSGPATFGPYTFDADNDADESAWTFVSTNGANGLNPANTSRAWSHDTNDTASVDVGPTSGQGGSPDGYVYTEGSSTALANDTFHMTNNTAFDASENDWQIEFYWNQRGNENLATVKVQTNEGGAGWVDRGTYATGGPDVVTGGTQVWNYESLDLTGVISNSFTQIRLLVTFPNSGLMWHNDFALDTITITGSSSGAIQQLIYNDGVKVLIYDDGVKNKIYD